MLLSSKNERLSTENQRQKQKQAQKRSYVARGGIFTAEEATDLINKAAEETARAVKAIKAAEQAAKAVEA
jgi:hypothetical protein